MFLKKVKLVGFKSFVDPTTLTFPGKLTAVVGPNGSGKSNIMDAFSWVMGENSMKYLRGETLTDVIFNGSTSRKPVGQASIELIFDNQEGKIGGEYSQYAEISIKRLLTRDSDSTYYLNNSVCRRKDILDIFSGTGLGPRSYSIIGQNMVSRIVESKSDDMRAHIEEAAGISKYKERRRETELRIQHTKDNLARVNDLRSELERQLNHLKRQASDAERYKTFKEQEKTIKSQWHAIQWRELDMQLVQYTLSIQQEETAQEAYRSSLVEIEAALEQRRLEQRTANDHFQEIQRRYYAVGNEIARIEQDLVHQQERLDQLGADFTQVSKDWEEANQQLQDINDELDEVNRDIERLEPEWEEAVAAVSEAVQALRQAETASQTWQQRWEAFQQHTMQISQQVEVERARVQHLQQKLQGIQYQQNKIEQEQAQFNFSELEGEIQDLSLQLTEVEAQIEQYELEVEDVKGQISHLQNKRQHSSTQLDEVRSELQKLRGKQASIEALQQAALGQRDNPVVKWLSQHELDKNPRLAQAIEVAEGWELAVEKVLGPYLQAVCIDQLSVITDKITDLHEGHLIAFAKQGATDNSPAPHATRLLDKVTSNLPVHSLLAGIYVASDRSEAMSLLSQLKAHESVITQDGLWLSPTWLRISHEKDPSAGVFQREHELKQLHSSIAELEARQEEIAATQEDQQEQLLTLDRKRDSLQQALNQCHSRAFDLAAQSKTKQERLADSRAKAVHLTKEYEEYHTQGQQVEAELTEVSTSLEQAQLEKEKFDSEREELILERESTQNILYEARQRSEQVKDLSHQLEIRLQSSKSQQGALNQTLERMRTQLSVLAERKELLDKELSSVQPIDSLKETLTRTLDKHVTIEAELNTSRTSMEALEQETERLEKERHTVEESINRVRNQLETLRLDSQGLRLKEETLQEYIKEIGFTLEDVLKELPPEANAEEWQQEYERITQRIQRLGSINLIAVEEYATCQERKQYLDKQFDDLQSSLETLENAIGKIDRETRAKFRETFDKINERFQELFPIVFGGGHATLELTDENLLESGVAVMACPPGKRNSSIHLLSGGEKSMTAIALIFSIFHLNPSPLCLLDEVDAALDDMNVSRFCDLVKKMADRTQFIFISHNKLAIEMAEHLIGIAMHEPGVSRPVTVDMQEAISMASA
jgi:chromosome segregation protein